MSSNTKILILKAKELIYTSILLLLGILLLCLLLSMFMPEKKENDASVPPSTAPEAVTTSDFTPGIYHSTLQLGDNMLDIQVTVDEYQVCQAEITNLNDTVTAMYPLISPTLEEINLQLKSAKHLQDIQCPRDSQYTTVILTQAIRNALDQ